MRGYTDGNRNAFLIDRKFSLNDVIRFERLNPEMDRICHHLKIPFKKDFLPRLKKGYRPENSDWEKFYDAESVSILKKAFDLELSFFQYDLPEIL